MAYDETLADRVRVILKRRKGITEKAMFGGLGFLMGGNMLVGIWKNDLILRLGKDVAEAALEEDDIKPFDITGRAMSGWAMAEPEAIPTDDDLRMWINQAIDFVRTLPPK